MRANKFLIVLIAVVMVLAACSDDAGSDDNRSGADQGPATAVGPGISVEEALEFEGEVPVLVNGFLIIDAGGKATLSSGRAESLPPQPAGATLTVDGIDPNDYQLSESQGVRWTDEVVQVLGTVDGETLVVSPSMSG